MKILDATEIITLSIKVTEEIHPKKVLTFIRTSIVNSQIETCEKSYFYFHYSKNTKTYEIMVFPVNPQEKIPEPFLFLTGALQTDSNSKMHVYLNDGYFVVLEKQELLLFKKIATESIGDIEIYLSQLYGLEDFEIIQVDQDMFTKLLQAQKNQLPNRTYPLYEERSYLYFLIFLCVSFVCIATFLYFTKGEKPRIHKTIQVKHHLQKSEKKPMEKILPLLEDMKKYGISLASIRFESGELRTTLYHTKKESLLLFSKKYTTTLTIYSLKFDTKTKNYSMEVIFVL